MKRRLEMHQENLYTSPNMAGRIKDIARTREITMKSILESCDLGSNTFSHMLHGKVIASDSLARIADSLNCSVDYLLGRTDTPILLFENRKNSQETGYSSSEVAAQIKEKLKEKKITAKKMLSDLGLSSATLGHYEKSMPKADNLALIADYLGVSVDYLLGRTDDSLQNNGDLREKIKEDEELLQLFHALPIHIRAEFILSMYNKVQELQNQ